MLVNPVEFRFFNSFLLFWGQKPRKREISIISVDFQVKNPEKLQFIVFVLIFRSETSKSYNFVRFVDFHVENLENM